MPHPLATLCITAALALRPWPSVVPSAAKCSKTSAAKCRKPHSPRPAKRLVTQGGAHWPRNNAAEAADTYFSNEALSKGITDQQSSGRCWLFTGLNVMRAQVIKERQLAKFEFSAELQLVLRPVGEGQSLLAVDDRLRRPPHGRQDGGVALQEPHFGRRYFPPACRMW